MPFPFDPTDPVRPNPLVSRLVRALGEPAPSGWLAQSMQQALNPLDPAARAEANARAQQRQQFAFDMGDRLPDPRPIQNMSPQQAALAGAMAQAPARPDALYGTPQAAGYANADEYAQRFRGVNRQAVGGIAQGVASLPADVVETPIMLAGNGSYVGNANTGDLRYDPNTRSAASYVREYVVDPLRAGAAKIGDAIAGGAPATQEQADARLSGMLTGNVGIWEAAPRSLMALSNLRNERRLLDAFAAEGGATLTPQGRRFAGSAYMVADPSKTIMSNDPTDLRAFFQRPDVRQATREGGLFGKWTEPGTSNVEGNISNPFPELPPAQEVARQRGELSIGNIQNGEYVGDVPTAWPAGTPNPALQAVAERYASARGLPTPRGVGDVTLDQSLAQRIADWYETAKNDPNDPATKAAYDAFNRETHDQFEQLKREGWTFERDDAGDAYKTAEDMRRDAAHKRLKVFTGGEPNGLMTPEQNFEFRAVHDLMTHAAQGLDFHAPGETGAVFNHAQLYSPEAQRALLTETVGQNMNLNYGPNGAFNRANMGNEIFPVQKAAVMPPELANDIMSAHPVTRPGTPAEVAVGRDAEGNVLTNRGRTIRDPNPPVSPRNVLPNRPAPSPTGSLAFDRPMLDAAGNVQPRSLLRVPENAAQPIPRPNPVYPTGPRGEAPPAPAGFDAPPPPRLLSRETKTVPDQTAEFGNRDEHIVRFALPNGDEANVVYSVDGKNLRVHFVGSTGGEGSVGAQGVAAIRDQLAAAHPDVTTINGRRISGARIKGGRGPGEGSIDVNRRGQGGTQTLGGMVVGGAGGAVAGAQVGDTPEERLRNSLLGLGGGMILGGSGAQGLTTRGVGEAEAAGLLRNELGAAGRAGRRYDLVHMSPERLTTIDPKYAGSGTVMRGAERRRGGVPKSYYFVKGSGRFEDAFDPRRYGRNLVRHDVSANLNLYDPSKPVESITRAYQRGGPDAFEKALKKAGYNGYLSVPHADSEYAQVAALFDALPVGGGRRGLLGNRRGAVGATPSIFDRSAPSLQGTATPDPRLFSAMPRGEPSELSQAIANSRVVERGLQKDVEAGLPLGGESWYEPGPIAQFLGEHAGSEAFRDWTIARGTGSIRTPTDTEIANASALLYGRRHGINDIRELSAEHQRLFPNERRLRLIPETHGPNFERAMADMGNFPTTPGSPDRKVPWYSFGNMGGGGEGTAVALDKHERLRLLQLANDDRKVRPLLREAGLEPRALGKVRGGAEAPITNALDYDVLSQPYQRIARRMGLLSPQQAQASRWIGGAGATGLRSERYGDFTQTLEDMVYQTALQRGLPTDPESLRELALKIMTGETISVVPSGFAKSYSGQGSLF